MKTLKLFISMFFTVCSVSLVAAEQKSVKGTGLTVEQLERFFPHLRRDPAGIVVKLTGGPFRDIAGLTCGLRDLDNDGCHEALKFVSEAELHDILSQVIELAAEDVDDGNVSVVGRHRHSLASLFATYFTVNRAERSIRRALVEPASRSGSRSLIDHVLGLVDGSSLKANRRLLGEAVEKARDEVGIGARIDQFGVDTLAWDWAFLNDITDEIIKGGGAPDEVARNAYQAVLKAGMPLFVKDAYPNWTNFYAAAKQILDRDYLALPEGTISHNIPGEVLDGKPWRREWMLNEKYRHIVHESGYTVSSIPAAPLYFFDWTKLEVRRSPLLRAFAAANVKAQEMVMIAQRIAWGEGQ